MAAERAAAHGSGAWRHHIFYEDDLDTYRAVTQINLEMENYDPWQNSASQNRCTHTEEKKASNRYEGAVGISKKSRDAERQKLEDVVMRDQAALLKSKSHKELHSVKGRSMKEKSDKFIEKVSRKIKLLAA